MSITTEQRHRPFSTSDKAIVLLQVIAILVVGALALSSADDPGWGDLQRLVILMMLGVWTAGTVIAVLIARLVDGRWWRYGLLLAGPFSGLVALVVAANT